MASSAFGGDSDTIAAITGSIAEAYYGIPEEIKQQAMSYVPEPLLEIVTEFYDVYNKTYLCGNKRRS